MAATNIQSFSGDVEVSSNLTVDTNTLHVDSVAGRVGIGKTDPAYAVDVNGTVNATALYVGGSEFTGFDETADPVAIGTNAGATAQNGRAVAIGYAAGNTSQGSYCVAIGEDAGRTTQSGHAVAIGRLAGSNNQSSQSVAIGHKAGTSNQGLRSVAVGYDCANTNQGYYAVAIGYQTAQYNQGANCIAIGRQAGQISQPANTFYVRYGSVRDANGSEYLHITTSGEIVRGNAYSDDRLKYNEKYITGAIKTLSKLRPQEYLKKPKLISDPDHNEEWNYESGLMAQDIYYSAPELRHIVGVPSSANDIDNFTPPPSEDPTQDPDYSAWGPKPASVKYTQLIPYLIKGIQETVTELPRSKTTVSNTWGQNIVGLVVSANTNTHKTNTTPIVTVSNVGMDKLWYGVVSDKKTDTNDYDTLIDTKGDTQIWVTDVGGPLESGDLVTTSNISPGQCQKQSDDIIRSYTVAKVTQDCDFTEPPQIPIRIPKQVLSDVTYYVKNITREVTIEEYELFNNLHASIETQPVYFYVTLDQGDDSPIIRYYHENVEVSQMTYDKLSDEENKSIVYRVEKTPDQYESLTDEEKSKYTLGTNNVYKVHSQTRSPRPIPEHDEEVVIQEMVDVLDENGQIVWEETANTVPAYTLVNHGTYKAALLTAKLV